MSLVEWQERDLASEMLLQTAVYSTAILSMQSNTLVKFQQGNKQWAPASSYEKGASFKHYLAVAQK